MFYLKLWEMMICGLIIIIKCHLNKIQEVIRFRSVWDHFQINSTIWRQRKRSWSKFKWIRWFWAERKFNTVLRIVTKWEPCHYVCSACFFTFKSVGIQFLWSWIIFRILINSKRGYYNTKILSFSMKWLVFSTWLFFLATLFKTDIGTIKVNNWFKSETTQEKENKTCNTWSIYLNCPCSL